MQRIAVLGSNYTIMPRAEMVQAILSDALQKQSGYVCVSNVHTTMMGFFDKAYQEVTNQSRYAVPDGVPLVWAMNALGEKQDRIRGPSLMRDICDQGRALGLKHFLYGSSPKTLAMLKETLEKEYPGIHIVGAVSPPFRALTEEEMQLAADEINASGAQVLWVGLGAPKQERWMFTQRDRVQPIMLGIGAAFDLLPGIVPEAPQWVQSMGLEWLYRLYREPKRLWRRYIFNNPAFLLLLGAQLCAAKFLGRRYLLEERRH
jgi:N-acetylglucosaminyldiphosphoundecaprenol N-acetyl-beta-D-mannosaminyltransferase